MIFFIILSHLKFKSLKIISIYLIIYLNSFLIFYLLFLKRMGKKEIMLLKMKLFIILPIFF
jgi:hypothetical protein